MRSVNIVPFLKREKIPKEITLDAIAPEKQKI
jgi:hypothetical protein